MTRLLFRANIILILFELIILFFIKKGVIRSNFGLEMEFATYFIAIGLQILLLYLTHQTIKGKNQNSLMASQLVIFSLIFTFLLSDLSVFYHLPTTLNNLIN